MPSLKTVDRVHTEGGHEQGFWDPPGPKATYMLPWGRISMVSLKCHVPA